MRSIDIIQKLKELSYIESGIIGFSLLSWFIFGYLNISGFTCYDSGCAFMSHRGEMSGAISEWIHDDKPGDTSLEEVVRYLMLSFVRGLLIAAVIIFINRMALTYFKSEVD